MNDCLSQAEQHEVDLYCEDVFACLQKYGNKPPIKAEDITPVQYKKAATNQTKPKINNSDSVVQQIKKGPEEKTPLKIKEASTQTLHVSVDKTIETTQTVKTTTPKIDKAAVNAVNTQKPQVQHETQKPKTVVHKNLFMKVDSLTTDSEGKTILSGSLPNGRDAIIPSGYVRQIGEAAAKAKVTHEICVEELDVNAAGTTLVIPAFWSQEVASNSAKQLPQRKNITISTVTRNNSTAYVDTINPLIRKDPDGNGIHSRGYEPLYSMIVSSLSYNSNGKPALKGTLCDINREALVSNIYTDSVDENALRSLLWSEQIVAVESIDANGHVIAVPMRWNDAITLRKELVESAYFAELKAELKKMIGKEYEAIKLLFSTKPFCDDIGEKSSFDRKTILPAIKTYEAISDLSLRETICIIYEGWHRIFSPYFKDDDFYKWKLKFKKCCEYELNIINAQKTQSWLGPTSNWNDPWTGYVKLVEANAFCLELLEYLQNNVNISPAKDTPKAAEATASTTVQPAPSVNMGTPNCNTTAGATSCDVPRPAKKKKIIIVTGAGNGGTRQTMNNNVTNCNMSKLEPDKLSQAAQQKQSTENKPPIVNATRLLDRKKISTPGGYHPIKPKTTPSTVMQVSCMTLDELDRPILKGTLSDGKEALIPNLEITDIGIENAKAMINTKVLVRILGVDSSGLTIVSLITK